MTKASAAARAYRLAPDAVEAIEQLAKAQRRSMTSAVEQAVLEAWDREQRRRHRLLCAACQLQEASDEE